MNILVKLRALAGNSKPSEAFEKSLKSKIDQKIAMQKPNFISKILNGFHMNRKVMTVVCLSFLTVVSMSAIYIREESGSGGTGLDDWSLTLPGSQDSNNFTGSNLLPPLINDLFRSVGKSGSGISSPNLSSPQLNDSSIGLSVGGAKDIENFRKNITAGYLPLVSDITYEGLFYDYYFDNLSNKSKVGCEQLFCPDYSLAVSSDPFTGEKETYMAVGLMSGMKQSDFERKNLNIVIVLDISGSMESGFSSYYYDAQGNKPDSKSKLENAKDAIIGLIDHLKPEDRLSVVLFDSNAYLAKPLNLIADTNLTKLKAHIKEIRTLDSTNMEAGYKMATDQLRNYINNNKDKYENRIIFLTDAMPNTGDTSDDGLTSMVSKAAKDNIYTSFIGVGVDFNSELIKMITDVKGANYFSIHSGKEFVTRMADEFDYMVTPLVFDLKLSFSSDAYEIEKVYGTDTNSYNNKSDLLKINTLFPSKTVDGKVKGGIVLVKLKKLTNPYYEDIKLSVAYKNRQGESQSSVATFKNLNLSSSDYYETNGIHKAIVLTRYANVMQDWLKSEYLQLDDKNIETGSYCRMDKCGIPPEINFYPVSLTRWERMSNRLTISESWMEMNIRDFRDYMDAQINEIGDSTMDQEIKLLDKILK